jgi:hypothetical protein
VRFKSVSDALVYFQSGFRMFGFIWLLRCLDALQFTYISGTFLPRAPRKFGLIILVLSRPASVFFVSRPSLCIALKRRLAYPLFKRFALLILCPPETCLRSEAHISHFAIPLGAVFVELGHINAFPYFQTP